MVRLEAQTSQIQQYQEMETKSCIEKSDLREELKQAREKIDLLEGKTAAKTEDQLEPPSRSIVPFAAIEERFCPQSEMSPYDDPADFAMLLESEELLASAISPHPTAASEGPQKTAIAASKKRQAATEGNDSTFDIPENLDHPQFTKKRKAVNFREAQPETSDTKAGDSRQDTGQEGQAQEERPTKTSKHVQKWTYSRVRTTSTEIQQERSTGSEVAARNHRRASPKSLVSASSSSHAKTRTNTRGRGKRHSRGMKNLDFAAGLEVSRVVDIEQGSAMMPVSARRTDTAV